jgi:hypothetical protein
MIDTQTFMALKTKQPFEPFRVHLANGQIYDVVGRYKFVPMESQLFVVYPDNQRGTRIPYREIASIEVPTAV